MGVQMHGGNCLLMWIDYLLSAEIIYCRSAIWPVLFMGIYMIWCIIFEFTIGENEKGDPYIYAVWDWSEGVKGPLIYSAFGFLTLVVFTLIAACSKNLILRRAKRALTGSDDSGSDIGSSEDDQHRAFMV